MIIWIQAHKEQLLVAWAILATILFHVSEVLGLSEKYKSSSVFEMIMGFIKKSKLEEKKEEVK